MNVYSVVCLLSLLLVTPLAAEVNVKHEEKKIVLPNKSILLLHSIVGTPDQNQNKGDIVLLHGAKFSSTTWEKLGTISILVQEGYRVISPDLPGGNGGKTILDGEEDAPEKILNAILLSYSVTRPILLSPSMSGRYSLTYLIKYPNVVRAYIPIAPTIPPLFNVSRANAVNIYGFPLLVIWGQNDTLGRERSKIFNDFKGNKILLEIPKASHPCYLDEPGIFHSALLSFLKDDVK